MTIDTSPAALSELADMFDGNYPREVIDALRAVAAEKEAQTKQEPFAWATKSGIARFAESGVGALTAYKKHCIPAKECQSVPLYLSQQPAASKMVAPADVPLSPAEHQVLREAVRDSVEVVHEGFVLADVPLPEPYDHIHEWDTPLYVERDLDSAPKNGRPPNRSIPVFTTKQFLLGREAYANAKVAEERERCAKLCDEIHAAHVAEFGDYLGASYAIKCKEAILANQKGTV